MVLLALTTLFCSPRTSLAQEELSAEEVLNSIKRGRRYLVSQQRPSGSWAMDAQLRFETGVTSLCLLSLMNSGMTPDDPAISRGLDWLRKQKPTMTYEIALMIMALTTAQEGAKDNLLIFQLAQTLEDGQVTNGQDIGGWGYSEAGRRGAPDRSNSQYAVLGLYYAARYGTPVERSTWRNVKSYWVNSQLPDGSWNYRRDAGFSGSGSMTVAGIASLCMANTFLQQSDDVDENGDPVCCQPPEPDSVLERAYRWMGRNFSVQTNPGDPSWWLYYMYGLERAGRLSGRRFFGSHDWYREGARALIDRQSRRDGSWSGTQGSMEQKSVIGTPLALLFLSKGLAPVLINKMKIGPRDPENEELVIGDLWNRHPEDIRNLVDHISTLPKWPKLLTWQTLDFDQAVANDSVTEMLQAPVTFVTCEDDLSDLMSDEHVELLREYITNGGFLFISRGCESSTFEDGLRELVRRLYPDGLNELMPLPESHPVYRSEYLLDPENVSLQGVDVGCRTAIIYSPEDLSCLWDKRMIIDPPDRPQQLKTAIARSLRIGVNVVAYVTGREPPNKLDEKQLVNEEDDRALLRGILSIAKLRHSGDWNAAPNAIKKLLMALERSFGVVSGNEPARIPPGDPHLYRHTLLYLHGQRNFEMSPEEIRNVRRYLENGGVLFSDACCGAPKFDDSFRELMRQMFPDIPLERIPVDHEIFSEQIGHNLDSVKRRVPANENDRELINNRERVGPPFLEGIKIDGRYAVVYSKYDISCALEKQTSLSCIGYTPEDAAKIAMNVVLYSVLQDVTPGDDE